MLYAYTWYLWILQKHRSQRPKSLIWWMFQAIFSFSSQSPSTVLPSSVVVQVQRNGIKHPHGACSSVTSLFQITAEWLRKVSSLLSDESSDLENLVDIHSNHPMHTRCIQAARIESTQVARNIGEHVIVILIIGEGSP